MSGRDDEEFFLPKEENCKGDRNYFFSRSQLSREQSGMDDSLEMDCQSSPGESLLSLSDSDHVGGRPKTLNNSSNYKSEASWTSSSDEDGLSSPYVETVSPASPSPPISDNADLPHCRVFRDRDGIDDSGSESESEKKYNEADFQSRHIALTMKLQNFKGNRQLYIFLNEVSFRQKDIKLRHAVLVELPHILEREFPNCVIYPFSSGYTGVGFHTDVLSVYVDAYRSVSEKSDGLVGPNHIGNQALLRIFHILKQSGYFCEEVNFSSHNRIQFLHLATGIRCCLEAKTFMKVQNSRLIKLCCILQPVVWPLVQLILYWSYYTELVDEDGFEMDAIVCLVMFFLINRKILPPVTQLQSLAVSQSQSFLIQNKEASICTDLELNDMMQFMQYFTSTEGESSKSDTNASPIKYVLELAENFFRSFGEMQFDNYIIASGSGKMIPKYFYKLHHKETLNRSNLNGPSKMIYHASPICVQDLIDDSLNITRKVTKAFVDKFQAACRATAHAMKGNINRGIFNVNDVFFIKTVSVHSARRKREQLDRAPFVTY